MKKIVLFCFLMVLCIPGIAQNSMNDYKYIVVPARFDMFNQDDKYRLNTLLRYLFKNEGYEVYTDKEAFPEDLVNDKCLGLYTEIEKLKGGIFKTKMQILLKDCYGKVVITSEIGESRQKAYNDAYKEAIENAFTSFKNIDHSYNPTNVNKQKEGTPVIAKIPEPETEQVNESIEKPVEVSTIEEDSSAKDEESMNKVLTAKPIVMGFEILNAKGDIVMVLLSTSSRDVFIVKDKSAVVFKNSQGNYRYSENDGSSLKEMELNIQF
jgi:hypothetical protein